MSSVPKLQVTKDYRLFTRSVDNRPLNPKKHKRLSKSMEKYGFLPCYPLACVRDKAGKLVVFDGQHRLALAETLNLPVFFVVLDEAFDIALVNCTQEKWVTRNFAETYAAQGKKAYATGLEFADRYGIPIGIAFGLLAGTTSWNNIHEEYYGGEFRIKDAQWAETVGAIYSHIVSEAPHVKGARLLEACMAVGRVDGFDVQRLFTGIERCREKLLPYATRDACLTMLEEVYNFGRKNLIGLRVAAIQTMRERNAVNGGKAKKGGEPKTGKSAA